MSEHSTPKQMVDEAKALWRRLETKYQALPPAHHDRRRIRAIKYLAWRRYQRRVDALLEANGVGYADKLPPIFGWRSWRDVDI